MITDLEVWLMGTPAQLDAALSVLAEAGHIAAGSKPQRLFGEDNGRYRRYVRVAVIAATTGSACRRPRNPA